MSDFPEHWQLKSIEEAMDALIDYRGKTPKKTASGIPLITAKIVKGGRIHEPSEFIAEDNYDSWMVRGLPEVGDVVVTTEAPLGEVAQIKNSNIALAQRIVTLRGKKGLLNNDFLLYAMQSGFIQHQLESRASGSTVKGIKQSELRKVLVPIPPENEQIEIAKHLKSIDSKIELNHQINQTLESIAQAIFKSWFVDFDPVKAKITALKAGEDAEGVTRAAMRAISGKTDDALDQLQAGRPEDYARLKTTAGLFPAVMQDSELGEVPDGWDVRQIQDLAKIIKGKSYKSAELAESKTALVSLKSFNRGGGYRLDGLKEYTGSYKAEQEVFAGDSIIAYTDVTQAADVIGKPAMVISDSRYEHLVISLDVAVVRPKINHHKYFLYGLAMTDNFQNHTKSYTTGTTVLHLGKSAVPEFQFPKPSEELLKFYEQNVSPMFKFVNEKVEDSRNMENLRNILLPNLLSGELSVDAIEMARGE